MLCRMDTAKLRVLYPGNHGNAFATERYVANAFESLGHQVERLDVREHDHDSIVAAAKGGAFDLFLFAKAGWKGADGAWPEAAHGVVKTIDALRPFIGAAVCHHFDLVAPEFSPPRFAWQQIVSEACDLTCLTDGYSAPKLPKCIVLRDGAPDDIDHDFTPTEQINGILFCGTLYRDRQLWVASMRRVLGPRFVHVGPDGDGCEALGIPPRTEVTGKELTRLVRSFRFCVQPPYPMFPGYWSDRITVLSAHGGLVIAPTVLGMEADGLRPWVSYLPATPNFDSFAGKIREYLDIHDQSQIETVRAGASAWAATKGWSVRVEQLLAELSARGLPRPRVGIGEPSADDEPTEIEAH